MATPPPNHDPNLRYLSFSIQERTRQLIRALPPELVSVYFYVQSEPANGTTAEEFARNVRELVITAPSGSPAPLYPLSISIGGGGSYTLKRTSVDELKYVRMTRHEIDELKETLPEIWEAILWGGPEI